MLKKLVETLRRVKEDWSRILSISRRPDRNLYRINLRMTFLLIALFGIIGYLIQLALVFIG